MKRFLLILLVAVVPGFLLAQFGLRSPAFVANLKPNIPGVPEQPHGSMEFDDVGTFDWTPPLGVNIVTGECWGAGASGANSDPFIFGGGGGGAGGYFFGVVQVVYGGNYKAIVGAGASLPGYYGENTQFLEFDFNDFYMIAYGGQAPFAQEPGNGGIGEWGGGLGVTEAVYWTGGNGGGSTESYPAGGGGGGVGGISITTPSGDGLFGGFAGETAGGAGGNSGNPGGGGDGGTIGFNDGLGNPGTWPGGGGGGGAKDAVFGTGGLGAHGKVRLTW